MEKDGQSNSVATLRDMGNSNHHLYGFGPLKYGDAKDNIDSELLNTILKQLEGQTITYETQLRENDDIEFFEEHGFRKLKGEEIEKYAKRRGKKPLKIEGEVVTWDPDEHGKDWKTGDEIKNVVLVYEPAYEKD